MAEDDSTKLFIYRILDLVHALAAAPRSLYSRMASSIRYSALILDVTISITAP